jgi:hypothetical protein
MLVPLLLAKYGPHRDALLKVMQTKPKGPGVADGLYFQLVATVKLLSGKRLDACWTQNVGRKNCHHSGLVMFLWKGLALLQPVGKNRCKDFVQLGLSQRKFIVRKLDPTMKSKLESLDRFGRDLQNSCTPRTTEDWSIEVSKKIAGGAKRTPCSAWFQHWCGGVSMPVDNPVLLDLEDESSGHLAP